MANTEANSGTGGRRAPHAGRIGFIGLGRMGTAMAANLAAAGQEVVAFVRRSEQKRLLAALGLGPTTNFSDLFECELVISMLPDDAAVEQIAFGQKDLGFAGLLMGLMPRAIHLSMSTISPTTASQLASEHARNGQSYVAAPVFGNPDAAKARQLFVIAAGTPPELARCQPIFDLVGQHTFTVGSTPATANLIKLAGNALIAANLEILGEICALARKRGLDAEELLAIMTGTMFGSRFLQVYGSKIAGQQYRTGGLVFPLALKDMRLVLQEAEQAGVPMPTLSVVRDRFITGIARGYSELDWSALGLLAAEEAGLSVVAGKPPATTKLGSPTQQEALHARSTR
ncbi:NAD(P)-dependent oxidoreductase [Bradyrhizobium canariense]|uniref:NAD(P)-dependent oxidoreductase n=1 Tax=Bradyrhizobium canariense TaxID=255045 RepID=UPI0013028E43|nr:NAD(P)-dependent oxidoreductase [Bradyrhizobium canariense]